MCTAYERFEKLHIDFSPIGIERRGCDVSYSCTPKNARIIGYAGVNGIHYCTIPEFGEMIFAVSPMNFGDCVHPIARNFEDLLRLLLYCVDMAALEQCYAWDEAQFQSFLNGCPATEEQQNVLDSIRREFGLEPMEDAFAYVKKLQAEFDLSQISYSEDCPDSNAGASVLPSAWKVTYDGGFWRNEGEAGIEVPIGKSFSWGGEKWRIPAVYLCDKGLVVDYFMEADPVQVKAFIDKWDLFHEDSYCFTKEQQEQIRRENPLDVSFHGQIRYNGETLEREHACGLTWLPEFCLPQGDKCETEGKCILDHYGLDNGRAWSIHRSAYRWGTMKGSDLKSLSVRMERERETFTGQHFATPDVGESVLLRHPLHEKTYTLTVQELEWWELPADVFHDPFKEYPTHLLSMSYTLEPGLDGLGFMLQDCSDGDEPRRITSDSQEAVSAACDSAATIGVIGGADGPTAIFAGQNTPKFHTACSSLYFDSVGKVEWRPVFSEKRMDDLTVRLISWGGK